MTDLVANIFSPALMTMIGSGFSAAAQKSNTSMQVAALKNKAAISNFEAAQLDTQAGQTVAAASRAVADIAYQAHLQESNLTAMAAAQGGALTDPSVLMLRARMKASESFNIAQTMANANESARVTSLKADALRAGAEYSESQVGAVEKTGTAAQIGGLFSGAASLYEKYGSQRYGRV